MNQPSNRDGSLALPSTIAQKNQLVTACIASAQQLAVQRSSPNPAEQA